MDYLSDKANSITPYVAGFQPTSLDVIKLNTNENPFPPSEAVMRVIRGFDGEFLRRYPSASSKTLVKALSNRFNVGEKNVFIGNGSDDVLALCFLAFFNPKRERVLSLDVTYSFYRVYAKLYDVNFWEIPLLDDFTVNIGALTHADDARSIIFANPNAPTGIELSREAVLDIVRQNRDKLVIVDEAYADFSSGVSVIDDTKTFDNLLVVRTFSKSYSLAGARVGFAVGNERLIEGLNKIKDSVNSYPVNAMSEAAAVAAISDESYFAATRKKIMTARDDFAKRLTDIGFTVLPSSTNFVFAKSGKTAGRELYERLAKKDIYVRNFSGSRINDFLRITVGEEKTMDKVFAAIKELDG